MRVLFQMNWTEYERGWGCRPDGISLHPDAAHANRSASAYDFEFNTNEQVPDEYTVADRRSIKPVEVSDELYAHVEKNQTRFDDRGKRISGYIGGNFKNLAEAEAIAIKVLNDEKSPGADVRS